MMCVRFLMNKRVNTRRNTQRELGLLSVPPPHPTPYWQRKGNEVNPTRCTQELHRGHTQPYLWNRFKRLWRALCGGGPWTLSLGWLVARRRVVRLDGLIFLAGRDWSELFHRRNRTGGRGEVPLGVFLRNWLLSLWRSVHGLCVVRSRLGKESLASLGVLDRGGLMTIDKPKKQKCRACEKVANKTKMRDGNSTTMSIFGTIDHTAKEHTYGRDSPLLDTVFLGD